MKFLGFTMAGQASARCQRASQSSKWLAVLIVAISPGCKTTQTWDQRYPKNAQELSTEEDKQKEFNSYRLIYASPYGNRDGNGTIQLGKDQGTQTYYTLGSYASVITQVSPDSETELRQLRLSKNLAFASIAAAVAGYLIDDQNEASRKVSNSLLSIGLAGMIGTTLWDVKLIGKIEERYNRDLRQSIFGHQTTTKPRPIGLRLSYSFAP